MIEPNMWIDRFFIRERIDDGTLCLGFVTSEEQIADYLTKGLSVRGCESSCDKMGMIDVYGILRGSVGVCVIYVYMKG